MEDKFRDNRKYDDMINLPHHVSSRHAPMSALDRAAQFSPFAALTGYEAVIEEAGRLTEGSVELAGDGEAMVDQELRRIWENIGTQPPVKVTWFRPDERKNGGAYISTSGRAAKLDGYERCLILTDGTVIPFSCIQRIEMTA